MVTATTKTWATQGENSPAQAGRILATMLVSEGVYDVDGDAWKVAEDTGLNMQVRVGSGVVGDLAAVEGDTEAGQGTYLVKHYNATQTLAVPAADGSDARIDRVILRIYDDESDSSGNSYADLEIVEGTPAGTPSAPDIPDSAISLATIEVGAGVSAITDADITSTRTECQLQQRQMVDTLPVLRGRYYNGGVVNFSTTEATIATVSLDIPTDWATYDVDVYWSSRSNMNGAANPATLTVRVKKGAAVWSQQVHEVSNASDETDAVLAGIAFGEDQTTTGTLTIDLTAQLSAEDAKYRCANTNLIVYAWRTS